MCFDFREIVRLDSRERNMWPFSSLNSHSTYNRTQKIILPPLHSNKSHFAIFVRSIIIESFPFLVKFNTFFHTYFTLSYFFLSSSLNLFHFPLYSLFI